MSFIDELSQNDVNEFDRILCPNSFNDDSQAEKYFDTHLSTPSPKLRRSKRLKAARKCSIQDKTVVNDKTVSTDNDGTESTDNDKTLQSTPPKSSASYATCESTSPFLTPPAEIKKATTTPGPPPRSLLKLAIGNATKSRTTTQNDDSLEALPKKRAGPRTSTPKHSKRRTVRISKAPVNSFKEASMIVEEPETDKKAARQTVLIKKRVSVKANATVVVSRPPGDRKVIPSVKTVVRRNQVRLNQLANQAENEASSTKEQPKKMISQKLAPARKTTNRKSLKTIKKRLSGTQSSQASTGNSVAKARKAAENRPPLKKTKPYAQIKSRVAEYINNGASGPGPNMREMKPQSSKPMPVKKPLHSKPFLPAGKVKYETSVNVQPGDLTVNGQTMAQFVKNFHYQTPKRYRTLKPTDNFQNTCADHTVHVPNKMTIPKTPNFATRDRVRKAAGKR